MNLINKEILLGVYNNKILLGEFTIANRNGYNEFTASFSVGEAFNIEKIDDDYKKDYYKEIWSCYDPKDKLYLLDDGEKTKQDVFEDWSYNDDYKNIIDCSCTDIEITKNNKTINFETTSGGQHDVRNDYDFTDFIFTNEKYFNDLIFYWDHYHLKEITKDQTEEITNILNDYSNFELYENDSEEFITNNINWSVL